MNHKLGNQNGVVLYAKPSKQSKIKSFPFPAIGQLWKKVKLPGLFFRPLKTSLANYARH